MSYSVVKDKNKISSVTIKILSFKAYNITFQPLLDEKLNLHDSCGVNNLHGMPGLLAGVIGAITVTFANPIHYDQE